MAPQNLTDLRTLVAKRLNFTTTTPDQDFIGTSTDTWKWLDDAINEAYMDEVNTAVLECSARPFTSYTTVIWAASTLTYTLPADLDRADILSIFNVTSNTRGTPFSVGDRLSGSGIVWRDRRTLEWGTTGPGQDTTLAIQYIGHPNEMALPDDEPELIPTRFRYLLVWAALVILRDYGDEAAPASWVRKREDLRRKFHKYLSSTAPKRTGQNGPYDTVSQGFEFPSYP